MSCSCAKYNHVVHKLILWAWLIQVFSSVSDCLAPRWRTAERATGFLAPKGWSTQHGTDVSQSVYNSKHRALVGAIKRDGSAGNDPNRNGLNCSNAQGRGNNLEGDNPILLFTQKDLVKDDAGGPKDCSERAEDSDTDSHASAVKRLNAGDRGAKTDEKVTVIYSHGKRENVFALDSERNVLDAQIERKNRTQPTGHLEANEPGQNASQKRSLNAYKETLYLQLLRMFSSASGRLAKDSKYVHDSMEAFIRDLKWDVWNSAATSQTAMTDFYNLQLERYKLVTGGLRRCMGDLLTRWKEVTNTWAPVGRLPLIKLTKTLGMHDARDLIDLQLLIDELIDKYHKVEREHKRSVMQTIKQYVKARIVAVVDSILPLRPATKIVKIYSWVKSVGERLYSWVCSQDKSRLPFNETGLFTYYEMPKSYIHTPPTWPREYQSLPLKGGGTWRLTFLGTGSRKPTKTRMTSAILFARTGEEPLWLFDCGESAITRVWAAGFTATRVKKIFLTHLHGDHCFGLFSFLYGSNSVRPLEVYGPSGTSQFIADVLASSSRSQTLPTFVVNELVSPGESAPSADEINNSERPFKVNYIHPDENMHYVAYEDDTCLVRAAPLVHTINTVGYVVEEKKADRMADTQTRTRKFVLCQDTFDSRLLQPLGMDADLVIHEATINAPTNCGSEMLMRLARQEDIGEISRRVLNRLDQLVLKEEMKFQMYQSTVGNVSYYYDRKMRALREELQLQQNIENEVKELETELEPLNILTHAPGEDVTPAAQAAPQASHHPSWTAIVKRITTMLKLYGDLQSVAKLVEEVERLQALIKGLRSSELQGMKHFKSRSMQLNMRTLAMQMLAEEGYPVTPQDDSERDEGLRVSRAIDEIAPLIFQYWADVVGKQVPLREDGNYQYEDWESLYNEYGKLSGHSTCFQAGEFAAKTRTRQLLLTHFSQNLPDILERENILTMARVVHSALRGYHHSMPVRDPKNLTAGAAWDMMTVTL